MLKFIVRLFAFIGFVAVTIVGAVGYVAYDVATQRETVPATAIFPT